MRLLNTIDVLVDLEHYLIDNFGPKSGVQVDGTESLVQAMIHSEKWGTLVFVMLEILFWSLVAGFLPMKGIYLKLQNIKKTCTCSMLYVPCE